MSVLFVSFYVTVDDISVIHIPVTAIYVQAVEKGLTYCGYSLTMDIQAKTQDNLPMVLSRDYIIPFSCSGIRTYDPRMTPEDVACIDNKALSWMQRHNCDDVVCFVLFTDKIPVVFTCRDSDHILQCICVSLYSKGQWLFNCQASPPFSFLFPIDWQKSVKWKPTEVNGVSTLFTQSLMEFYTDSMHKYGLFVNVYCVSEYV